MMKLGFGVAALILVGCGAVRSQTNVVQVCDQQTATHCLTYKAPATVAANLVSQGMNPFSAAGLLVTGKALETAAGTTADGLHTFIDTGGVGKINVYTGGSLAGLITNSSYFQFITSVGGISVTGASATLASGPYGSVVVDSSGVTLTGNGLTPVILAAATRSQSIFPNLNNTYAVGSSGSVYTEGWFSANGVDTYTIGGHTSTPVVKVDRNNVNGPANLQFSVSGGIGDGSSRIVADADLLQYIVDNSGVDTNMMQMSHTGIDLGVDLFPRSSNAYKLGTTSKRWSDLQTVTGTISSNATVGGSLSLTALAGGGTLCLQVNNSGLVQTTTCGGSGYLPLSGGTMTGTITSQQITPGTNDAYSLGTSSFAYHEGYFNYSVDTTKLFIHNTGTSPLAAGPWTVDEGYTGAFALNRLQTRDPSGNVFWNMDATNSFGTYQPTLDLRAGLIVHTEAATVDGLQVFGYSSGTADVAGFYGPTTGSKFVSVDHFGVLYANQGATVVSPLILQGLSSSCGFLASGRCIKTRVTSLKCVRKGEFNLKRGVLYLIFIALGLCYAQDAKLKLEPKPKSGIVSKESALELQLAVAQQKDAVGPYQDLLTQLQSLADKVRAVANTALAPSTEHYNTVLTSVCAAVGISADDVKAGKCVVDTTARTVTEKK